MSARVVLRAASGARVGAGHVRRSRAVACALRTLGAEPLLVVDDAESARALRAEGFDALLPCEDPAWAARPADAAWVDGFGDFAPELMRLRRAGARTILVENRTHARHFADLVLYPALHWRPDAWDREHAASVLGGAPWIPLAPELGATRADERDVDLLVTFGGSDPKRLTERVLALLDPASVHAPVVSVGWHMAERLAAIRAAAARFAGARVLEPGSPLGPWMARARAALTALGTTLYELAFLRTPAGILANHTSDREALEHYREHGPHRPLGIASELDDATLAGALRALPRAAPAPAVAGLGGGAARLALVLLGRAPPGAGERAA